MRSAKALLGATATAAALLIAGPAAAAPTVSDALAEGLDGPLQIDATDHGIYFSQSNLSGLKQTKLSKLRKNGQVVDLITLKGANVEIAGVDTRGEAVAFTLSRFTDNPTAKLRLRQANGVVRTLADLQAYEERRNPDRNQTYGLQDLDPGCEVPPFLQAYQGIVESHPYAVANGPKGSWFVADAAGNSILKVARSGNVSTVAVLPPQPAVITEEAAEANELPPCTVGKTFVSEPVPTDLQFKNGSLYVTLLPGGPEDPSLGARGKLMKIDAGSGQQTEVASGLLSATNVALAPGNKAYVAELFGGAIQEVDLDSGDVSPYVERPLPAALDFFDGTLFATDSIFGPPGVGSGQIVAITDNGLVD